MSLHRSRSLDNHGDKIKITHLEIKQQNFLLRYDVACVGEKTSGELNVCMKAKVSGILTRHGASPRLVRRGIVRLVEIM